MWYPLFRLVPGGRLFYGVQNTDSVSGCKLLLSDGCVNGTPRRRRTGASTSEYLLQLLYLKCQLSHLFGKFVDSAVFHAEHDRLYFVLADLQRFDEKVFS